MELKNINGLLDAMMGIEKESLRITKKGEIAKTRHPFPGDSNIKMDFAECQLEIATPIQPDAQSLYESLYTLHLRAVEEIKKNGELLWCLSSPPPFKSEDEIAPAVFDNEEETNFRLYLASKYGKKVMLYSGIHFNFSFGDRLIKSLFQTSELESYRKFKDKLYLSTAKNCIKYIWFLVYLTGASPLYHKSLLQMGLEGDSGNFCGFASMRNSPYGYRNKEYLFADYSSVEKYVKSVKNHIKAGKLKHISELYSPVRLKAKKENSSSLLLSEGIEYLELRVFDLNPFSPCGFSLDDIELLHLFMIFMLSKPDFILTNELQAQAENNRINAARLNPNSSFIELDGEKKTLAKAAVDFAKEMKDFCFNMGIHKAADVLERVFERVYHPESRYAQRLMEMKGDYLANGLKLTEKQADMLYEKSCLPL